MPHYNYDLDPPCLECSDLSAAMNLSRIPVKPPPPGSHSNFVNPPSLLGAAVATTIVLQLITFPFIAARAYINVTTRKVRAEDIFSHIAWAAFIAQSASICVNSQKGMAAHSWDVSLATMIEGSRRYNSIFICYTLSGGFAKATVMFLQLKRIFTTPMRGRVYWVIMVSLVLNAIAYTCFIFFYIFTCTLREKIWNPSVRGRCMDSNKLNMAIGALNTISDIEAFLVPIWAVWQLRMNVAKKFSVLAAFGVGAVAVAIGCLGMYYRVLILTRYDITWLLTQTGIICMAELNIVIIYGCCPLIPRILRKGRQGETNTRGLSYENVDSGESSGLTAKEKGKMPADPWASLSRPSTESEQRIEMHEYKANATPEPRGEEEDERSVLAPTSPRPMEDLQWPVPGKTDYGISTDSFKRAE